ncbi:MAG: hypothetical protein GX594_19010 [Pirellulaceae bacterium]|nr:hypothetical protein [Pirellulaceae bacterium]
MLSVLYPWALAIAVVCSAATAFGIKGVLVGVILLAAAEYIGCARSALNLAGRTAIAVICCLLLFGMLIPNLEEGRISRSHPPAPSGSEGTCRIRGNDCFQRIVLVPGSRTSSNTIG